MNLSKLKCDDMKRTFKMKQSNESRLALRINNRSQCSGDTATINKNKRNEPISRIVHLTYDCTHNFLALVNQDSDLYVLDFNASKYWKVPVANNIDDNEKYLLSSCTIIKFNIIRTNELIYGDKNGNVILLNINDGIIVDCLKGHNDPIVDISFTSDGNFCITCTINGAILWNLTDNSKLHVLSLSDGTTLRLAQFVPTTNDVIGLFKDNTIHVWKYETFDLIKTIPSKIWKYKINTIALTRNGRALAIGGNSNTISIYDTKTWELSKTIEFVGKSSVRRLEFVSDVFDGGSNRTLTILTSNGKLSFYDMIVNEIIDTIDYECEIIKFTLSFDGRYVACCLSNGDVNIYHVKLKDKQQQQQRKQKISVARKRALPSNDRLIESTKSKSGSVITNVNRQMNGLLDVGKLKRILLLYGEYPSNYRTTIWSQLLRLPMNRERYRYINEETVNYGTSFTRIEETYPLRDKTTLRNLKSLLINLVNWCPFFGHVAYLPLMVFPFVKVFKSERLSLFETIVTFILNWCQNWFEYHPMLPLNVLSLIENMLIGYDPDLVRHFTNLNVKSNMYAWTLMETSFSEVVLGDNWCTLWDHVFSNEPSFYVTLIVSFNIVNRNVLLTLGTRDKIVDFYRNGNNRYYGYGGGNTYELRRLLKKTYELMDRDDNAARQYVRPFKPLTIKNDGNYDNYPTDDVHYPRSIYDNVNKMTIENDLDDEKRTLTIERERLIKMDELKAIEERDSLIRETEKRRLDELESYYDDSVRNRRADLLRERERLTNLKKLLREEEFRMSNVSRQRLEIDVCRDKQKTMRKLIDDLETSRIETNVDVLKVESDMIDHYGKLLTCKRDVERLLMTTGKTKERSRYYDDTNNNNNNNDEETNDIGDVGEISRLLRDEAYRLNSEIESIRSRIDSKSYLKNLNLATGLCALYDLIDRIETKLNERRRRGDVVNDAVTNNGDCTKLIRETKEFELETKRLLQLTDVLMRRENNERTAATRRGGTSTNRTKKMAKETNRDEGWKPSSRGDDISESYVRANEKFINKYDLT